DGVGSDADLDNLLAEAGGEVDELDVIATGGGDEELLGGERGHAGTVGPAAYRGEDHVDGAGPDVGAVGLAEGAAELVVGVAGVDLVALDVEPDDAETGLEGLSAEVELETAPDGKIGFLIGLDGWRVRGKPEALLDVGGGEIDKDELVGAFG